MSSSELKRGRAGHDSSPEPGGQENKRPRIEDENFGNVLDRNEETNELLFDLESDGNDKVKAEARLASRRVAPGFSPPLAEAEDDEDAGNSSLVPAANIAEPAQLKGSLPAAGEVPLLLSAATPVPVAVAGNALPSSHDQAQARQGQASPEALPEVRIILGGIIDLTGDTDDEEKRATPPPAPVIIDLTGDTDDEEERPPQPPALPNPNEPRARSPRSPTPLHDDRIALWKQENRRFPGTMTMDYPVQAKIRAERACTSPLWVNGVPQIIIFCDGSRKCERNRESEASSGGYGLVLRNPWANNVNNVDNQEGAAAGSAAARMPFGFTLKSGFGVRSWSYNKIYSPANAESGALAQSLLVALQLVEQHRPGSVVIELFTDSQECWHRINSGLDHRPWQFSVRHVLPIMRAIVWLSWRLKELGGHVKVRWNPRRCAIGPILADNAAGRHLKIGDEEELEFNQRHLPLHERDRILLMLNEEISAVVREREMAPLPLPNWFDF